METPAIHLWGILKQWKLQDTKITYIFHIRRSWSGGQVASARCLPAPLTNSDLILGPTRPACPLRGKQMRSHSEMQPGSKPFPYVCGKGPWRYRNCTFSLRFGELYRLSCRLHSRLIHYLLEWGKTSKQIELQCKDAKEAICCSCNWTQQSPSTIVFHSFLRVAYVNIVKKIIKSRGHLKPCPSASIVRLSRQVVHGCRL